MSGPSYVSNWDSGQPQAFWDSGLDWDPNTSGPIGDPTSYLNLITSEHRNKPNFVAFLTALIQPLVDMLALISTIPTLYDIDVALGSQLDATGQWVGISRNADVPLTGVYFELDSATLGLDQGVLQGPFDPTTGLIQLPDDVYRTLLYLWREYNRWDSTIASLYSTWNTQFQAAGFNLLIQDEDNMHMIYAVTGSAPNPLLLELFLGGYLTTRPAGVMIDYYMTPDAGDDPYFGLDCENSVVAGLDVGGFGFLNNGTGY